MIKVTFFYAVLAGVLLAPAVGFADFDIVRWEYRSRIEGSGGADGFVILQLPNDFFGHLKADLSDLRVISEDGEVPYVAAIEREESLRTAVSSRFFNLSSIAGENTSFIVDVGASGVFHNSVTIDTTSENFRRVVEVQGSDDEKSWRTLNANGQIFDFTVRDPRYVNVKETTVFYPEATFRYLRVVVYDRGDAALRINNVRIGRDVKTDAHESVYVPELEIVQNDENRTTDLILDLGVRGIPHREAILKTSNTNFSRAVAVYDSDNKQEWRLRGHGYIFAIDTPKFRGTNLKFKYPESNKQYVKLSIINQDDRPITVSEVTLFGVVRSILFSYDPAEEYYVYLGNSDARRPRYDIERVSQYLEAPALPRVSAGPVDKNPSFEQIKPPLTERSPYILPTVLGLVVAVLAFLLIRLVLRMREPNTPIS
jgi:hypothetical protein